MTAALPPDPPLLRDSKLAPRVLGYNQVLMAYVPEQVKITYEEKREELYREWVAKRRRPQPFTITGEVVGAFDNFVIA